MMLLRLAAWARKHGYPRVADWCRDVERERVERQRRPVADLSVMLGQW